MSVDLQQKAAPAHAEGMRREIQLAVFRVGAELYALDIMGIREIIRPQKLTPVPNAPPFIEGVLNLRGAIIPVLDLRKRFGLVAESDRKTRVIICAISGKAIGLMVDDVQEVRRCTRPDIQPPPQLLSSKGADFFIGICRRDEDLILLLDLEKVLSSREMFDLETVQKVQEELAVT